MLESHFRIGLDKWRDLNLSEDFTRFARTVDARCENLPQVLHNQDEIVDTLLKYVEKGTAAAPVRVTSASATTASVSSGKLRPSLRPVPNGRERPSSLQACTSRVARCVTPISRL